MRTFFAMVLVITLDQLGATYHWHDQLLSWEMGVLVAVGLILMIAQDIKEILRK